MFKKFFSDNVFEIYCFEDLYGVIPEPYPAFKAIPKWFKNVKPHVDVPRTGRFGDNAQTVKKCLPVLDAMSEGFIIPLQGDVTIHTSKTGKNIEAFNSPLKLVEFHSLDQVGGITWPGGATQPIKFINYWIIKTKPGWSTLFIPPINHFEDRFTCLGGLVDTDKYDRQVNFPAVWHKKDFDGLLSNGTPLVQCIPIKRGSSKNLNVRQGTKKEFHKWDVTRKIQDSRDHYYTKELRDENR